MKYDNLFSLKNKIAVITGGTGLIGKEFAKGLAEAGAVSIIADIDEKKARRVIKEFSGMGLEVIFKPLDITKESSVSNLINFIDKKFGKIDIWINNAYPRTRDWGAKFEDIKFSSWKKNIDMHLNGYFICSQKIAEYMRRREQGVIINMASIYGVMGPDFTIYKGTEMTMPAAYSAIKGGIIAFSKYLASYYGKYNIRVNCISPGGVKDKQPKVFIKNYTSKVPLMRMVCTEDLVGGVIYLASDASTYVTGHNLLIDGGWTIV